MSARSAAQILADRARRRAAVVAQEKLRELTRVEPVPLARFYSACEAAGVDKKAARDAVLAEGARIGTAVQGMAVIAPPEVYQRLYGPDWKHHLRG